MVEIIKARNASDISDVKTLILEFIDWLHERYPDMREAIETYFSAQGFDAEMADILAFFGPPCGECLLAKLDGEPVGILLLKSHSETVCEMNRMFVRSSARGRGIGNSLCDQLIKCAQDIGYKEMILSALDHHHEALPLYKKMGFVFEQRAVESGNAERELHMRLTL